MASPPRPVRPDGLKTQHSVYDLDYLRQQCRWIRDELDPQVARDGPDALHSDDILKLDELLRRLLSSNISLEDIRSSRLHLALTTISGQGTRWPNRLIDRADAVKAAWVTSHGLLRQLTVPLYEPGGRLHGICRPEDTSKEKMMVRWLKEQVVSLSPMRARRSGDLGFKPGDWWINPLLAFRDGIIDSAGPIGGISADSDCAYAILMTADEEIDGPSPDGFTYRARSGDRGRYRLTSATRESTKPVRILRSHSLRSFWAPKAGVRYGGLHIVAGWSIRMDPRTRRMVYDIQFKRLPSQVGMNLVLRRPFSDEVEDYKEYKRIRQVMRDAQGEHNLLRAVPLLAATSIDGHFDLLQCDPLRRDSLGG